MSEWGPEQKSSLEQVPTIVQAALPFVPYDPADVTVLAIHMADRDVPVFSISAFWFLYFPFSGLFEGRGREHVSRLSYVSMTSYHSILEEMILWDFRVK